jgi:hypothetical protein
LFQELRKHLMHLWTIFFHLPCTNTFVCLFVSPPLSNFHNDAFNTVVCVCFISGDENLFLKYTNVIIFSSWQKASNFVKCLNFINFSLHEIQELRLRTLLRNMGHMQGMKFQNLLLFHNFYWQDWFRWQMRPIFMATILHQNSLFISFQISFYLRSVQQVNTFFSIHLS